MTNVLPSGRISLFSPCISYMQVKEIFDTCKQPRSPSLCYLGTATHSAASLGDNVFFRTLKDEKSAMSIEHRMFFGAVEKDVC